MKIFVKVKASARQNNAEKIDDTHFAISVAAPPRDGKANKAVLVALADYLKVPTWRMTIISGLTAKEKIIEIS